MDLIITKSISLSLAIELFLTKIPPYFTYTFPMAIFLAVIFVIGQFNERGEIMAMKASGASIKYFLPSILIFAISAQFVMFYFSEIVSPKAYEREKVLMAKAYNTSLPLPSRENVFFNEKNKFYFFKKVDPQKKVFEDILLIELLDNGDIRLIVTAKKAQWNENGWHFLDGKIYSLEKDGDLVLQGEFQEQKILLDRTPNQIIPSSKPLEQMSIFEILDQIRLFQRSGLDLKNLVTEFNIRIALPFTCPIFAVLALGLGLKMGRSGRSISFGLSLISIFIYYIIFSIGRSLAKAGMIAPFIGAWLGNLIFLSLGVYLLWEKR